jgi:uncharacterized protein involved in response to NO
MPLPYRPFFAAGLVFAAWGAALWILFPVGRVIYPGLLHADLMVGGFLVTTATGFLLTAVPRFTDTAPASTADMVAASVPALALASSALGFGFRAPPGIHGAEAGAFAILLAFVARRLPKRRAALPPSFVFLVPSLAAGFLGALLHLAADLGVVSGPTAVFGRLLLLHAAMLGLVLGVGMRMVPALLGHPVKPGVSRGEALALLALFFAAFPLEAYAWPPIGRALRAAVITWIALRH